MAPKPKKGASSEKQKDISEPETPLQAVILVDSFETKFSPFTTERPRCLLPLANVALIDHTLQFLADAGVKQVFIYCGAHTAQIEKYIKRSRWIGDSAPFETVLIRSTSRSIGDAMRDLDGRGILVNDFVVVYGDIVSNIPLDIALAEHKARRAADKNAIMTMVLRQASANHRSNCQDAAPVFVLDPQKKRCLHYEQVPTSDEKGSAVELSEDVLNGRCELEVRTDLIDCGIDICTPDVLALWSDNFDYEQPRKGFLHSVLKDYELNGKTIHSFIAQDCYAARVRNLLTYRAVSSDILAGWTNTGTDGLLFARGGVSFSTSRPATDETSIQIHPSCQMLPNSLIGKNTLIDRDSLISGSTIGARCRIGAGCRVENAVLWDDINVGDDTVICQSIVGSGASIGKNCTISEGTLISFDVEIPKDTLIRKFKRLSRATKHTIYDDDDDDDDDTDEDGKVKGDWKAEVQEYQEVDEPGDELMVRALGDKGTPRPRSFSQDSVSSFGSDLTDDSNIASTLATTDPIVGSLGSEMDLQHNAIQEAFVKEASSSIMESLQNGHDVSTIQLELQGLRMKDNAPEHYLRVAIVESLVRFAANEKAAGRATKVIFETYGLLIERAVFDKESKQKDDQADFLLLSQQELSSRQGGDAMLLSLCNDLYLLDIIEEEGLTQWWHSQQSVVSAEMRSVRAKTAAFMKALAEAGADDSEVDDSEDDDSSEEE